ncbi:hypothetical protein D477_020763 [Arthrobacter crystallopoietes BAB-32]|uniref:Uncharacterized protein n=1 Tax=Arthrobacter crystallopoietes BAB-32 TaxID=1246476 RepID=N1UX56_9MICC|nr:hypothetical protein [Arthrobacter crystallopoietes]EMY32324.1 hypothetical protein D477_020763 [Arthrobacter crystallopoietes BAB-32]
MSSKSIKLVLAAVTAGTLLVLGAAPAAARSSEGASKWSYGNERSVSNSVQTPSGNYMVGYEGRGSYDDGSSYSYRGNEVTTTNDDGTTKYRETSYHFSYKDSSGTTMEDSYHYANKKTQYQRSKYSTKD